MRAYCEICRWELPWSVGSAAIYGYPDLCASCRHKLKGTTKTGRNVITRNINTRVLSSEAAKRFTRL